MKRGLMGSAMAKLRGYLLRARIHMSGGKCGPGLRVGPRVQFKYPMRGNIELGNNIELGSNIEFHVDGAAYLKIGSNTKITGQCFISCAKEITIENDCLIAEFVSIRDADHGITSNDLISKQPLLESAITIGAGTWIARGVCVLRGVNLGDGCVVGANAVVNRSFEAGSVLVGMPAKIVRSRKSS